MSDHETFSAELPIQPDVAVIHLYLSKLIYRPGEEGGYFKNLCFP